MGAVTYPYTKVAKFIKEALIPLQVLSDSEPLATDFTLRWTPTLIILDTNGKEHSRTVGFIPPEEFIPTILLGMVKTYLDLRQFDPAIECLEKIINNYPQSFTAPEAIYYRGVCVYKTSHDAGGLKRAYERLAKEYPQSEWVKRAFPYRLLP
jgi:tetratricopeptide (TPR) repeat protein